MVELMIISALVLLTCILSTKVLYKFGVPMLLIFIGLGMLFGSEGLVGIYFDDYNLAGNICSLGLIFILFHGGFGTKWEYAKPVAIPSVLMSTLGVIITAGLTGLFCHFVLGTTLVEGLLIGAIISATDSASVFAILRSQKLNLKGSLASLLEIESGSNDPIAYMLTIIIISLTKNANSLNIISILTTAIIQISLGLISGLVLAKITMFILERAKFEIEGFYTIFVIAIALLSYSLTEHIGGNGYLCVYITGILIGNSKIPGKKFIFNFFDGLSWIMQIILFFILGLLSFPSELPNVVTTAIPISIFMIVIARPLTTFIVLSPFKFTTKEKIFVSWVGLRGAGSVVFAILAITKGIDVPTDIFHTIFFMAIFSVSIQGTFIPRVAKILDLVDDSDKNAVLKTFTDYMGDINTDLLEITISKDSKWINKTIMEADIPEEILIVMIKRGMKTIIPKGNTKIKEHDILVLSCNDIKNIIE